MRSNDGVMKVGHDEPTVRSHHHHDPTVRSYLLQATHTCLPKVGSFQMSRTTCVRSSMLLNHRLTTRKMLVVGAFFADRLWRLDVRIILLVWEELDSDELKLLWRSSKSGSTFCNSTSVNHVDSDGGLFFHLIRYLWKLPSPVETISSSTIFSISSLQIIGGGRGE